MFLQLENYNAILNAENDFPIYMALVSSDTTTTKGCCDEVVSTKEASFFLDVDDLRILCRCITQSPRDDDGIALGSPRRARHVFQLRLPSWNSTSTRL